MTGIDPFRYDGKRALVVGGATGMGAAVAATVAEWGAEVVVLDHAPVDHPVAQAIQVDLRRRREIDAALDQLDGPLHAVFSAAGVADGTDGLMRINFIGHRHIVEHLVADGRLGRGGAVCMISSVAGLGWERELEVLTDLLATPDFDAADRWVQAHEGTDNYLFSKQAVNCYVARSAHRLLAHGVRINAVCPGPTDTPLARANADLWLGFGEDYRAATGTEVLTPEQIAPTMAFLNSDAAVGISGVTLLVDNGHMMASLSGAYEPDQAIARMLFGRT